MCTVNVRMCLVDVMFVLISRVCMLFQRLLQGCQLKTEENMRNK